MRSLAQGAQDPCLAGMSALKEGAVRAQVWSY